MKKSTRSYFVAVLLAALFLGSCKKDPTPDPAPAPPLPPTPVPTATSCTLSGILQRNSGSKAEFALAIQYDNNLNPVKISVFDSVANKSLFNATLMYATADSIRIDQYQYIKLDTDKRVVLFVTKADLTDPVNSDNYRYQYVYNADGYLVTKNLYINGSATASYVTTYIYNNNLLMGCVMTAAGLKMMESTLGYDASLSPKATLYSFPDAFESCYYATALNFGTRPAKPFSQITSKVYNPVNGTVLDTWSTTYGSYVVDSNSYLSSGITSGDQQQGLPVFYGKTYFTYQCK